MSAPKCAHCDSTDVIGYVRLLDAAGEYDAIDHALGFQGGDAGLFGVPVIRTPVRATVCASCGAVAFFVIGAAEFASRFREMWPDTAPGDWPPTGDNQ